MEGIENEYLKILEKKEKNQKLGLDLQSTSGDSDQNDSDLDDGGFDAGRSFTGSMQSLDNDSLNLEEDMDAVNYYIVTLKPHKIYKFELTFTPQNTKKYEFNLPLRMGNNTDYNPELQKLVSVESVPPKIILDPIDGVRDFKKKIITHTDQDTPDKMALTITNPDYSKSLNFFIKCDELEADRVFVLSKSEGSIAPNKSMHIEI
jgi:hypothetical protein